MIRSLLLPPLLAAAFLHAGMSDALGPPIGEPWQGESIYQIVTDRFFNGDFANDNAAGNYNPAAGQGVHGGDFKGIEQKLDYIKALGATAIWISPVVENGNGDYHGYAARDFYKTAPQMGTMAELKQLVDAAHGKGLRVINDIVVNHGAYDYLRSDEAGYPNFKAPPAGYGLRYRDNAKQYAPPFHLGSGLSLTSLFHNNGFIRNFEDAQQVERGSLQGLDDFNTEHAYVREQMANIYKFWIDQVRFDGFRVDTVKHVEHGFWQTWCPQIRQHAASKGKADFLMFGEVYDANEAKIASYTGTRAGGAFEMDSALDYPLYFSINGVFAIANTATRRIEDHYHAVDAAFDPAARSQLVTFLDNHDQPRFLNSANAADDAARLGVALVFQYTARGIPSLYYGTEQGFNGGADPTNREDMFAGQYEQGPSRGDNFNMTHPLFQLVAKLNNLRRLYPALREGAHVNLWNNPHGPGLFAYARRMAKQEVFVVFNTSAVPQTLPGRPTIHPAGTVLVDVLNPADRVAVNPDGRTAAMTVGAMTAKVFVAEAQTGTLDPVVVATTPEHDTSRVPTPATLVVRFSQPMDRASVEEAFTTMPATTGTFEWGDGDSELRYQPSGAWPELSTIFVRIGDSARDTSGRGFHAAFECRFGTAEKTIQDVTPPTLTMSSPQDGSTISGSMLFRGTVADDVQAVQVEVKIGGGAWRPIYVYGSGADSWWHQYIGTDYQTNGYYTVSARAIDAAGNTSPVTTIRVKIANVPVSYEQHLFAYGERGWAEWDCDSRHLWSSDGPYYDSPYAESYSWGSYGYVGGETFRSGNPIAGVCPKEQFLYQSERYSSSTDGFRYVFRCPPGLYQVDLLEAETFMTGPNERRFDVYAQGQKVLQNFDIFAEAGGANRALVKSFTTTVRNTLLDVQFKPVFNSARLSAIRVRKIGEAVGDDGVADWWRLMYFDHVTGTEDDQSRAEDDPDGDGHNNLQESQAGTDPHDRAARFAVSDVRPWGNHVYVQFHQVANRRYQLQRTDSLSAPNWQNIGWPHYATGTGQTSIFDYDGAAVPNPKFYRLVIVP